jgi:hypothetical protein
MKPFVIVIVIAIVIAIAIFIAVAIAIAVAIPIILLLLIMTDGCRVEMLSTAKFATNEFHFSFFSEYGSTCI